jgi:hypothetical protein
MVKFIIARLGLITLIEKAIRYRPAINLVALPITRYTMITHAYLHKYLHYSIITGQFYWIKAASPRIKVGDVAGNFDKDGYIRFCIGKSKYFAHRLAWFWITGEWPKYQIDHKNGVPNANYWINLREATPQQNSHNAKTCSNNTSGYKGVCWCKKTNKWWARITLNNQRKNLGYFNYPELAYAARLNAEKEFYGEFIRVNP